MVQIVNMSPKPSMAGSFGEGFNQGFSTSLQHSIDAGLAYKLNDMLDAKKYARQQEETGRKGIAALSIFKPNASDEEKAAAYALGPDMTIKLMENLGESGFASFVASGKVPVGGQEQQPQQPRQNNVLGQPQVETINIQGMPERQAQQQQQQQPPFMLPQQQQQQAQQSPQQQTQQPAMPEQAMQRAASMSDREWADWLDRQQISKDWKIKYSHERTKQQEMDLKQRADARAEREDMRKQVIYERDISDAPPAVKPYVTKIAAARSKNEQADKSLKFAEMALESGDASGIMQYYASIRGIEPLKTMDTALLDAASKDFLTGTLSGIGSKANMWLEKQIRSQFPVAGSPTDANKARLEVLKTQHDISKKEVELFDKLSDEDQQKYGSIQPDIQRRVGDQLKEFSTYRMNVASVNIQELRDSKRTQKQLASEKVAKGTPLTQSRVNALWSRFHDKEKIEDYVAKAGFEKYDTRAKK